MKRNRFNNGSNGNGVIFSTQRVPNEHESRLVELCNAPVQEALEELKTTLQGLSAKEADHRLDEFGPNELKHLKRLGFWADMLHRFRSPLVIQLLVIALVSAAIGELKATVIVSAMVLLSVGLSYILDRRSSQAVDSLGKRVQPRTFVLRDGVESEIRNSEIVPGDVVLLQAGSIIPADLRLIAAKDFFVSESALTGESMPVEKAVTTPGSHDRPWTCRMPAFSAPRSPAARPGGSSSTPASTPCSEPFRNGLPKSVKRPISTGACVPSPGS